VPVKFSKFLVLASLSLFAVLFAAFAVRPHVLYAWHPFPFWLLAFLMSALLTGTELAFARASSGKALTRHWTTVLATFNFVVLLSHSQLWRSSSDAMYGVLMARNFQEGLVPFPNFFFVPGLSDFSQSFLQWNYFWTPLSAWGPLFFLGLFKSPAHGMQFMTYVCQLAGLCGWMAVGERLLETGWRKAAFGIIVIACAFQDEMSLFYASDVFAFAASPWLFWFLLVVTRDFRAAPDEVPLRAWTKMGLAFGAIFIVKYSSVFSGLAYLLLALGWGLSGKRPGVPRLRKLACLAFFFALMPSLLIAMNRYWGAGSVPSPAGDNPVNLFSNHAAQMFQHVLAYPGYVLSRARVPMPKEQALIILFSLLIYIFAAVAWKRSRNLLPAVLLALLLVPGLGLWWGSLMGNNFSLLIPRYQYSFTPAAFLLVLLPFAGRRSFTWLPLGVTAVAAAPLILFLGTFIRDSGASRLDASWQHDPLRRITQSAVISGEKMQILNWLSRSRPKDSMLLVGLGDEDYQVLLHLRGKVVNLSDSGALKAPVLPYYLRNGFTPTSIGQHEWRTSKAQEVFIYSPYEAWIDVIKPKFPQVKQWKEVIREPGTLVIQGTAVP